MGKNRGAKLMYSLIIDKEFRQLSPRLSPKDHKKLEKSILKNGCHEPICVWNNIIIDGHSRFEICTLNNIPFSIAYIFMKSRESAIVWICTNQLRNHNISIESRRYLIGKRFEAEKVMETQLLVGSRKKHTKQMKLRLIESVSNIGRHIGEDYNISLSTVVRYESYAKAMDVLTTIAPNLTPKVLSGEVKMKQTDVVTLSQLSPGDIINIANELLINPENAISQIMENQPAKAERRKRKPESPLNTAVAIKESPVYDPDAVIGSLIFTIPSWISAIERTATTANYGEITTTARAKLERALLNLSETAQTLLDIMEESTHE